MLALPHSYVGRNLHDRGVQREGRSIGYVQQPHLGIYLSRLKSYLVHDSGVCFKCGDDEPGLIYLWPAEQSSRIRAPMGPPSMGNGEVGNVGKFG